METQNPAQPSSIQLPSGTANVIILTSGITGSSVLAGLLSQSGFWTGDKTYKKEYDTYENTELINCNLQMLREAGCTGNYAMEFSREAIDVIASVAGRQ